MPPSWGRGGGGQSPFTPSRELTKTKSLFKRAAHIMQSLEHEAALKSVAERVKPLQAFRVGDVVDLQVSLPDNKARLSSFRGLVIARRNRGLASSVRLRSVVNNFIVERAFPLYSPNLKSLTVVERRKAVRAKLYFLRRKPIKASRVAQGGGAGGAAITAEGEAERALSFAAAAERKGGKKK